MSTHQRTTYRNLNTHIGGGGNKALIENLKHSINTIMHTHSVDSSYPFTQAETGYVLILGTCEYVCGESRKHAKSVHI